MGVSKFRIAEQVCSILGKGTSNIQEILVAVSQAFASVVKAEFFRGKEDGVTEVNGNFIFTFPGLTVSLDTTRNKYYATLPTSYISLPHEYGIVSVSLSQSDDQPFIRINAGQYGLFRGLDSESMEDNQVYFVEGGQTIAGVSTGGRIYLPKVTAWNDVDTLMVKLAVSLDGIDDDTELSLPPDIQDAVITLTVQKYAPQQPKEKLN